MARTATVARPPLRGLHVFECEGDFFLVEIWGQRIFQIEPPVYHVYLRWPLSEEAESGLARQFGEGQVRRAVRFLERLREQPDPAAPAFTEDEIVACYRQAPVTTVNLVVSYDCNFRCTYCYARELRARPGLRRMSRQVARQAVDLFLGFPRRSGPRCLTFKFSGGGEPLTNASVVRDVLDYASRHPAAEGIELRFKLSTNGLLLDDALLNQFAARGGEIKISIDGPPAIHQRSRCGTAAVDDFERLLERIDRALAILTPRRVAAAITLTRPEEIPEIFRYTLGLGFRRIKSQKAILPLAEPQQADQALARRHVRTLFQTYLDVLQPYLRGQYPPEERPRFEAIDMYLEGINRREHRLHLGCYAGIFDCAVTPDGSIYSCNRFAEVAEQRMGHVATGLDPGFRESLCRETNILRREICRTCWLIHWCGGGCRWQNSVETGSMLEPSPMTCAGMRAFFEQLIRLYVHLRRRHPEFLRAMVSERIF